MSNFIHAYLYIVNLFIWFIQQLHKKSKLLNINSTISAENISTFKKHIINVFWSQHHLFPGESMLLLLTCLGAACYSVTLVSLGNNKSQHYKSLLECSLQNNHRPLLFSCRVELYKIKPTAFYYTVQLYSSLFRWALHIQCIQI